MTATATISPLTDPIWAALLDTIPHDVFHVPEFLAIEDEFLGTETVLARVVDDEHFLLMPLVFIELDDGWRDAVSPRVHASPLVSPGASEEWQRQAVKVLLQHLREQQVVSAFIRLHPLFAPSAKVFAPLGGILDMGWTYSISLEGSLDDIRDNMRSSHRRNIRKAKAAGHAIELDAGWEQLDSFVEIYGHTMDRLDAHQTYRMDRRYFERMRDELDGKATLWGVRIDGLLAGAHVVTECGGTSQYLYGATHREYYRQVPQVAIFDAVLEWSHARGNQHYFLGGGVQESLLHFKEGFTRLKFPVQTVRIVIDPVEYGRRCGEWLERSGEPLPGLDEFFPTYRRPVMTRPYRP